MAIICETYLLVLGNQDPDLFAVGLFLLGSLQELMAHAQRAHGLVDDVDFNG